jgi:hypothetical protein
MTKIGIIIPSTNRGLNCKSYKDIPFYKIFLKYFIKSYNKSGKYRYKIFMVVDKDDPIYSSKERMSQLKKFISLVKFLDIDFIWSDGIEKGHVTAMWNRAFEYAYKDGCEYFYQAGDDVCIMDKNWEYVFIEALGKMNNLGVVGPFDYGRFLYEEENNVKQKFLLTQSFVSRLHYEIFGFYFDPAIKNWFCDDWITYVYGEINRLYCDKRIRISNMGGDPRYTPVGEGDEWKGMTKICRERIDIGKARIKDFIEKHNAMVEKMRKESSE